MRSMTSRSSMGETLDILTLLRQYPAAPVDIETRMHPATQHPGTLRRKQTLVEEKRDHAGPEQLFQRLEADLGQYVEKTGTYEQAVREQHVQVRVEVEVFPERMDGRVEMRRETTGCKELVRWVLSWMPDVRVLAPKSLRDRIVEKLQDGLHAQE